MRTWRWYSKVLFAVLVAAFAYWVWPTRYAYRMSTTPMGGTPITMRVDRFTGRVDLLAYDGWRHYGRDLGKQTQAPYRFRYTE